MIKLSPDVVEFERRVRSYLSGDLTWDSVHQFAIDMECRGTVSVPKEIENEFMDLHFAFLLDEHDDPQFLATKEDLAEMARTFDQARSR